MTRFACVDELRQRLSEAEIGMLRALQFISAEFCGADRQSIAVRLKVADDLRSPTTIVVINFIGVREFAINIDSPMSMMLPSFDIWNVQDRQMEGIGVCAEDYEENTFRIMAAKANGVVSRQHD